MVELASDWTSYQLLDSGDGEKVERWNDVVLVRPDSQAIWHRHSHPNWNRFDGRYHRSSKGGGSWEFRTQLPEYWNVSYKDLIFKVSPTNFKHVGLFPEQAVNWDWLSRLISSRQDVRVLNLFAYTGACTMACSKAGAREVVHVDAAKGMVAWAKENMALNHLEDHTIRFIVDDVLKFVQREQRRGNRYDVIIMDPPSYGRGPNNELWKLEDQLEELIVETGKLLSEKPLAFLVNCYTTALSPIVINNLISYHISARYPEARTYTIELGIPHRANSMVLPCGISGRVEF